MISALTLSSSCNIIIRDSHKDGYKIIIGLYLYIIEIETKTLTRMTLHLKLLIVAGISSITKGNQRSQGYYRSTVVDEC